MLDLSLLNNKQKEAATYTKGPLLVLAGAGSGKTRVISYRIAYLLEKKVSPKQILAVTFTNKAAGEMKERVISLVGPSGSSIWLNTFHSAAVKILRKEAPYLDISPNFVILSDYEQGVLMKEILSELNLDESKHPPRSLLAEISRAKSHLVAPEQYKIDKDNYFSGVVSRAYPMYQKKLRKNNALDFDDLISETVRLFCTVPERLTYYQDRFLHILIDEYQDINTSQYFMVKLLAEKHRHLCVVGDDDQSIYRFRGADHELILNFERDYPEAKVVKLEQNYRSTKLILDTAYYVVKNNVYRKEKRLWTDNRAGDKLVIFESVDERDEASFVAGQIKKMMDSGCQLKDFVVLYRTNAQSRIIEEVLLQEGLPYQIIGGLRFYDRKEIKDIVAYLKLIANPDDTLSLKRIINVPPRGIGPALWQSIGEIAEKENLSLYEALPKEKRRAVQNFYNLIEKLREKAKHLELVDLVREVADLSGYLDYLKKDDSVHNLSYLENIEELYTVAQHYSQENEDKSLSGFLDMVSLMSDLDSMRDNEHGIILMTLHNAKGLEFKNVFIVGLEEGVFPHYKCLQENDERALEEERRLCYVGITRAMEQVYLTHAWRRTLYGKTFFNPKSRFLQEMPTDNLLKIGGRNSFHTVSVSEKNSYSDCDYNPGDRVSHPDWGKGLVLRTVGSGETLEIVAVFPKVGQRRVLPDEVTNLGAGYF